MSRSKLTMYFLVDGETEQWYLQWLAAQISRVSALYWADFRIGVHMGPDAFARRMRLSPGETVYLLLDYESRDAVHERKFQDTLRHTRMCADRLDLRMQLGYSNYAFELWLILHRVLFTRPVCHRKDYLRPLNQAFGTSFRSMPNYKKEQNFRRLLTKLTLDDVRDAIARGSELRQRNAQHETLLRFQGYQYYRHDPSLSVDLVVADVLRRAGIWDPAAQQWGNEP